MVKMIAFSAMIVWAGVGLALAVRRQMQWHKFFLEFQESMRAKVRGNAGT